MGKPKQTAAVIAQILGAIDAGELLPGGTISEADLMARCDVSRTPVREALIHLEADGLVVRHPRKGVRLFSPSVDEFLAILEVHAGLEAQAAELAARRLLPAHEAALQASVTACSEFAGGGQASDHAQYYALNMQFHAAVAEAACNPFLTEMIKLNARKLMAQYRLRYRAPGAIRTSAQEHADIARLILARDPDGARAAMLRHFNYDRETVMHMIASVG